MPSSSISNPPARDFYKKQFAIWKSDPCHGAGTFMAAPIESLSSVLPLPIWAPRVHTEPRRPLCARVLEERLLPLMALSWKLMALPSSWWFIAKPFCMTARNLCVRHSLWLFCVPKSWLPEPGCGPRAAWNPHKGEGPEALPGAAAPLSVTVNFPGDIGPSWNKYLNGMRWSECKFQEVTFSAYFPTCKQLPL